MAVHYNAPEQVRELSQPIVRRPTARVRIEWAGANIDPALGVETLDNNRVSYPQQVYDGNSNVPYKWLCADSYSLLDGGYHPMPDNPNSSFWQVGWRGSTICNSNGIFPGGYEPYLRLHLTERAFRNLSVVGDVALGEYPTSFHYHPIAQ